MGFECRGDECVTWGKGKRARRTNSAIPMTVIDHPESYYPGKISSVDRKKKKKDIYLCKSENQPFIYANINPHFLIMGGYLYSRILGEVDTAIDISLQLCIAMHFRIGNLCHTHHF